MRLQQSRYGIIFSIVMAVILPYHSVLAEALKQHGSSDGRTSVEIHNASEMADVFQRYQLSRSAIEKTGQVASLYINAIPADLQQRSVAAYKELFILLMLPNITAINLEISAQRKALIALKDKAVKSPDEQQWLANLGKQYRVKDADIGALLMRVDEVPAALALAQSINESAWGSSRFALQANALFGQHLATGDKGQFIRAKGADIKVAAFDTPLQGVRAYMQNLNTSKAYHPFRVMRQQQRASSGKLDAMALATTLERYSARGKTYVRSLQQLMQGNALLQLDDLQLAPPAVFIDLQ